MEHRSYRAEAGLSPLSRDRIRIGILRSAIWSLRGTADRGSTVFHKRAKDRLLPLDP